MNDEKKGCKHDFRTHDMRGNKEEYIHDFGKKRGLEIWKWDGHKLVCCKCGKLLTLKLFEQKIRTQQKAEILEVVECRFIERLAMHRASGFAEQYPDVVKETRIMKQWIKEAIEEMK